MADTSQRRRILQCPRCGAENPPTNRFCGQCGAELRGDTPGALATSLAPKSGAVLPYSPGLKGPGPLARLALVGVVLLIVFCLAATYVYLTSGADRTPARPTSTPVGITMTIVAS